MAKFKCILSGNVFVFESEYDIQGLRKHPDYVEVIETDKVVETNKVVETDKVIETEEKLTNKPTLKKAGRPRKESK